MTRCPECLAEVTGRVFCSDPHKAAFHNRQTVRGRAFMPLIMADRITRGGSRGDVEVGKQARRDAQRLMDRWALEDREATPPRMNMVEYVAQRDRLGYRL